MSRPAKIERKQKLFLKAMKEKFADTTPTDQWKKDIRQEVPEPEVEECPMCAGRGYRKRAFCHTCGGTGQRKVRP